MKRTIKSYIEPNKELMDIALMCLSCRNYFFSRYSGIKSLNLIGDHRKLIRDELVKSKFTFKNLPPRYWKCCLDQTISNIKSNWTNQLKYVLDKIKNRKYKKLETEYIQHIIKNHVYDVLNCIEFNVEDEFQELNENEKYKSTDKLNKILSRTIRKYKSVIPHSDSLSFLIDNEMYSYNGDTISIQSLIPLKRIKLQVNDSNRFHGSIIISFDARQNIILNRALEITKEEIKFDDFLELGIDKNYTHVISTSSDKVYGENLGKLLDKKSDYLTNKNKERQKFYDIIKNSDDKVKINNINKNNLGKIKYNKKKNALDEPIKQEVNIAIKTCFLNEKPNEVTVESLKWKPMKKTKGKKFKKSTERHLSAWMKGYIQERIEFYCIKYNIKLTEINAALTSQISFPQGKFNREGVRTPHCDSAKIVLNRKHDPDIKIWMNYFMVRTILQKRLAETGSCLYKHKTSTVSSQTQPSVESELLDI